MHSITVFFEDEKLALMHLERVGAGQTLLQFFLLNNITIRHDCGGICHCTTCHIYVEKGEAFIEEPTKRETDFLKKVAKRKLTSRLACQCLLVEGKGEIEVRVPAAQ